MLRFADSYDCYAKADITKKYNSFSALDGDDIDSSPPTGRHLSALQLGQDGFVRKTLDAQATWIAGFALYIPTLPTATGKYCYGIRSSGAFKIRLYVDPGGLLRLTKGESPSEADIATSTSALSEDTWYFIECKVTIGATGGYEVRVNGETWLLDADGNTGSGTGNEIGLYGQQASGAEFIFDDLYVLDGTDVSGIGNNDFLGDIRVEALFPAGAGNKAQWTPSAGANYTCVDEAAPNADTDYVKASVDGKIDTYDFTNIGYNYADVYGVQECICARKDDEGSKSIQEVTRSGGADYEGEEIALGDTYEYVKQANNSLPIREADPDTDGAWSVTTLNAAEFGMELVVPA